jgi:hypothetical protein
MFTKRLADTVKWCGSGSQARWASGKYRAVLGLPMMPAGVNIGSDFPKK